MAKHKQGKGRATKKARAGLKATGGTTDGPASFVFYTGKVSKNVQQLVKDVRHLMEPFTASRLKVRRNNVIKDFVSAAGIFNVSHLVVFTQTETAIYMKLIRLPRGPTLIFRICSYALSRDIIASLKDPHTDPKQFLFHPLAIMNNFSSEGMEVKLMSSMFQNMFPSINVGTVNIDHLRRCVVFNYNPEDKTLDFTHCNIQLRPAGISRPIKKLIKSKVPDMSKYSDINEYVTRDGNLSESEAELDAPINEVTLPQKVSSRGNMASGTSSIRLNEIGPRITMKLQKIEEGVCDGEVLYHDIFKKTEEEIENMIKQKEVKRQLREERKKEQEENVKRKLAQKRRADKADPSGAKRRKAVGDANEADVSEDDDKDYFEKEVGTAPDPDVLKKTKKKRFLPKGARTIKRFRRDDSKERNLSKKPSQSFRKKFLKKSPKFSKSR